MTCYERFSRHYWFFLSALLFSPGVLFAQNASQPSSPGTPATSASSPDSEAPLSSPRKLPARLRVVCAGSPPFVIPNEDASVAPTGLSIDIWRQMAKEQGLSFDLSRAKSAQAAIDMVAAGEADVAIGPISITSKRAEKVAFTQPYLDSSLAILAPADAEGEGGPMSIFLSKTFLYGLGGLFALLFVIGTLIWLVERRKNPDQFPSGAMSGIGNGTWMALVTMTTVGYGDRVPVSPIGRAITGVWMLASLILVSLITAFMTASLTIAQLERSTISKAEDLQGRPVGVVGGTTAEEFAKEHGARGVQGANLQEIAEKLIAGEVDAVVFDQPILRYLLQQNPEYRLVISDSTYEPQGYGFAVSLDSPLGVPLDVSLLDMRQSGDLKEIVDRWLGP